MVLERRVLSAQTKNIIDMENGCVNDNLISLLALLETACNNGDVIHTNHTKFHEMEQSILKIVNCVSYFAVMHSLTSKANITNEINIISSLSSKRQSSGSEDVIITKRVVKKSHNDRIMDYL
eukprot:TRINITY_DN5576_c0_g2_i4.p1 TRINITY_DN5576_c0_g2~~TRINITY_DN5576_c0_g2_i4.p1  ORF type:complete len:122 (+),score=4.32 TRINITY_DN5576_c0_g2_i4:580-945(+)